MALNSMASHEKCRFFDLPRHVRDVIYREVLEVAHPLYLFKDSRSPKVELFAPEKRRRWLALLFTNRQLHAEARAILYSNHFTFVDNAKPGRPRASVPRPNRICQRIPSISSFHQLSGRRKSGGDSRAPRI